MTEKMKNKHHLNGGYSLIELVVTVLMSGLIVVAITGFLTTGLNHYRVVSAETEVQSEAQVVELFVTELFQESINFETISSYPAIADPTAKGYEAGSAFQSAVWLKRKDLDDSGNLVEKTYMLAQINDELHFAEVTGGSNDELLLSLINKGKSKTYLGEYVTSFRLLPQTSTYALATNATNKGIVYLELKFEVDERVYDSSSKIALRNKTMKQN